MPLCSGSLQPAPHRSLIGYVVRREVGLQVVLLARDDHQRHQRQRWNEADEEPETVGPACDSKLEQRERQIDGIAAEAIGPRTHDRGGGTIARNRRTSGPKRAHSPEEQRDSDQHRSAPEWPTHGTRHEPHWPSEMQQQAQGERSQVDKRRPYDPEVRDFRHHACLRLLAAIIACHTKLLQVEGRSPRAAAQPRMPYKRELTLALIRRCRGLDERVCYRVAAASPRRRRCLLCGVSPAPRTNVCTSV